MSQHCLSAVTSDRIHVEIDVDDGGVTAEAIGNEHLGVSSKRMSNIGNMCIAIMSRELPPRRR